MLKNLTRLKSFLKIWESDVKTCKRGKELACPLLFLAERFRDEGRNEGIEKGLKDERGKA